MKSNKKRQFLRLSFHIFQEVHYLTRKISLGYFILKADFPDLKFSVPVFRNSINASTSRL